MTYDAAIHQIECRWRERIDLSPIASSLDKQDRDAWFYKLKANARQPQQAGNDRVPESSAVYRTFSDGTAAFIWRQYDLDAKVLSDAGNRRPLVARILVGNWEQLNPDVAIALCRSWDGPTAREILGSRSGQVEIDQRLRQIEDKELDELRKDSSVLSLDLDARKESGLDRLVAAVLRAEYAALNVQLPSTVIGDPSQGPQVSMLRGLRMIAAPLLCGLASPAMELERWSFSTYELPFKGSGTNTLPKIVFRAMNSEAPSVLRPEITVSPKSPMAPGPPDIFDETATILVSAYKEMPPDELRTRLDDIANNRATLKPRLEDARIVLARLAPKSGQTTVIDTQGSQAAGEQALADRSRTTDRAGDMSLADSASATSAAADVASPRPTTGPIVPEEDAGISGESHTHSSNEATLPAAAAQGSAFTSEETQPAASSSGRHAAGRPASPAPAVSQAGVGAQNASARQRDTRSPHVADVTLPPVVRILRDLAHAGTTEDVKAAFERLHALGRVPVEERAPAREELRRSGWCFEALNNCAAYHIHSHLERLFAVTVIPDLRDPDVQYELASWAYSGRARPMVMKALYTAAQRAGAEPNLLMNDAVLSALGERWLDDHDVFVTEPDLPAGSESRSRERPEEEREPIWSVFRSPVVVAAVAAIVFFILFVASVLLKW
jgi:hypothetical protein